MIEAIELLGRILPISRLPSGSHCGLIHLVKGAWPNEVTTGGGIVIVPLSLNQFILHSLRNRLTSFFIALISSKPICTRLLHHMRQLMREQMPTSWRARRVLTFSKYHAVAERVGVGVYGLG